MFNPETIKLVNVYEDIYKASKFKKYSNPS